jgi:hypothetical protein
MRPQLFAQFIPHRRMFAGTQSFAASARRVASQAGGLGPLLDHLVSRQRDHIKNGF